MFKEWQFIGTNSEHVCDFEYLRPSKMQNVTGSELDKFTFILQWIGYE